MERIADGVLLVRGGLPRVMNVYLIEDEGGVTVFDAGVRGMHKAILKAAGPLGGMHYFKLEILRTPVRQFMRHSLLTTWDDGPTPIEGTLEEGDEVAGFQVIHLPGHAPGLIGLYRESDGLVLSSDVIYTLNPLNGIKGPPRIPHEAFNMDTEMAQGGVLGAN
ncbi:MAG: MBL fold metallo-hydrolase [Solirubrobacterales bacterium]